MILEVKNSNGGIMITVREAKRIAQDWVEAEAPNIPNFRGAFLIGSILWKDDDDHYLLLLMLT